jgi:hypothetical protein
VLDPGPVYRRAPNALGRSLRRRLAGASNSRSGFAAYSRSMEWKAGHWAGFYSSGWIRTSNAPAEQAPPIALGNSPTGNPANASNPHNWRVRHMLADGCGRWDLPRCGTGLHQASPRRPRLAFMLRPSRAGTNWKQSCAVSSKGVPAGESPRLGVQSRRHDRF